MEETVQNASKSDSMLGTGRARLVAVMPWVAKLAIIYDLVLFSLLLVRWFSPLSSFGQVKAAISSGALGGFWMLGRPYLRKIADKFGFRPHSLGAILRRLPTPSSSLFIAIPLIPLLHLGYGYTQPVEIQSESGSADWICNNHYQQPYLPIEKHISQGTDPVLQCRDAFAGEYEHVFVRRGRWRATGSGRLTLSVDNGKIAFVAFTKRADRQNIHLEDGRKRKQGSEVDIAQPGPMDIAFALDDPIFTAVDGFSAFVSLQGIPGSVVKLRAGLVGSGEERSIDAVIPLPVK